ncbi:hypothetical protein ACFZB6_03655 [Streptomyces syringium]|uniref:hypothetical protein n=1 Tax=Streptomyces syringium TaxID=76729 RepID=UPI0036E89F29
MNVLLDPDGCLSSRYLWCVTLSPEVSARIRDYRPQLPPETWARVGDQVRATVAAAAPGTCYDAGHLLHVVGRLAAWADAAGLPRDPAVWLRTETIDAFVLTGCTEQVGTTLQTYRSWLRRTREALVWVQRGEAPPARLSAPGGPQPPYTESELGRLRAWAELLAGRARLDGLALMAMTAGCGLAPGELSVVRGTDIRTTRCGIALVEPPWLNRLVACGADWEETLSELAAIAGEDYMFRPQRKVTAAKNLVNSWPARHRPHAGLPPLSARRLRSTWIVGLLTMRIDPALVAESAGMASTAALAPYYHWVPPLDHETAAGLLRGRRS